MKQSIEEKTGVYKGNQQKLEAQISYEIGPRSIRVQSMNVRGHDAAAYQLSHGI